jgi:ABC-type branched-subunit amino acid transport system ATPase component
LESRAAETPDNLPLASQKFLEIARAMMSNPRLLLLDEPAAGLNETEISRLVDLMNEIRADGVGILLVEHNMKLVMSAADEVCVLNHGKRIADGTPSEILANKDVIAAYLGTSNV